LKIKGLFLCGEGEMGIFRRELYFKGFASFCGMLLGDLVWCSAYELELLFAFKGKKASRFSSPLYPSPEGGRRRLKSTQSISR
jgi:hypothetical protein